MVASLVVAGVFAAPLDIDSYVQRAMKTFEVPGASVVVLSRGETIQKAYGVRRLGEPAHVDEHTLFAIGSNTKAFTAAGLAILVDEGKLSWDDKVIDRLPGFRMYDPYVTHEITIRDLLSHRAGLGFGAGDLLFYPGTTLTRRQIVERIRHIAPASSFRSRYTYSNVLYVAAGRVLEEVSGRTWERFVRERILAPLNMKDAAVVASEITTSNHAWPHARTGGVIRGVGAVTGLERPTNIDNAGPAGAMSASAEDMARWLRVQLDRGRLRNDSRRLFSETVVDDMRTPQTIIPVQPPAGPLATAAWTFDSYALGWFARDYRGERVIMHAGGVPGAVSMVVIVPAKQMAFAILTNSEELGFLRAIYLHLLDDALELPTTDWTGLAAAADEQARSKAIASLRALPKDEEGGPPSLPLARYAGTYEDAWLGTVRITTQQAGLNIVFDLAPTMIGRLEHVRHDTFRTRFADASIEDAYLTFWLTPQGSIERIGIEPVSPQADFSFDYQDLRLVPSSPKQEK